MTRFTLTAIDSLTLPAPLGRPTMLLVVDERCIAPLGNPAQGELF